MSEERQTGQPNDRQFSVSLFSGIRSHRLTLILFLLFTVVMIRNAWLHEDAFITLRTVGNFIDGYGLRWNVAERVQTYTHPLWMLLLSAGHFLTREHYFTTIVISLCVSLLTVILLHKKLESSVSASIFMLLVLVSSRSYIDYTTSGLENPLNHLLLVLFCTIYFAQPTTPSTLFRLTLIASSAGLNRLDTLLFYLPALLVYFIWVPRVRAVLTGCLPLFGWLLFALFYYGFPFPNSAYAKLHTHIPAGDLVLQGLFYFKDLLWRDPLTLLVIASGLAVAVLSRNRRDILMAAGISLYLLYIIAIGGDYMSGRFFTAPLLGAVILWLRSDWLQTLSRYQALLVFGIVLFLGSIAAHPVLWPIETKRRLTDERGITDERLWYESHTGLLQNLKPDPPLTRHWLAKPGLQAKEDGSSMLIKGGVGMAGFYAGPDVYVLDTLALADLLSARLPVRNVYFWRIGHFARVRPAGYDDTLRSGHNQIEDPNIAAYYDALSLIARGPLLDSQRIVTIWRINTGQYDHLIDADEYIARHLVKTALADVSTPVADGTPLDAPEVLAIPYEGVEIELGDMMTASVVELSLDTNYEYHLVYLLNGTVQGSQDVPIILTTEGMQTRWIVLPKSVTKHGFDTVRVFPKYYGIDKKHQRALGHFILHGEIED